MRFFRKNDEEAQARLQALQQALASAQDELAKAWKLAALLPTDRVVCLLADAARVDEAVVAQVLNALMREDYNANASQALRVLVDEVERYLREAGDVVE